MRLAVAAFAAALSLTVTARAETPEVRIARQFSMGYLQFNVIDHEHLIQKHAAALGIPDVKVSLIRFNGPAAMNDALLSDSVDIVGGSPNGMWTLWAKARNTPQEVRAITALVTLPFALTSSDPEIKTLADIGKCKKIPVPSVKVSSPAVFVQLAYTVAYTTKKFHDRDPKLYQAVYDALTEATERVRTDIQTASRYWIEDSDSKLSVDFVAAAGTKDTEWTTVPLNTLKQADFMADVGTIKVRPASWKDYFFPEAYGLPGS
jgi:ABC-type nitrate/sulfonate/bicarbonate transport system substrate-binding protein